MNLLPDIERELMRVARLPLANDISDTEAAPGRLRRRASRRLGFRASSIALLGATVLAVAIAAMFVSLLHTRGTPRKSNRGPTSSASSPFPGAPHTQPNGYGVETGACPLAARNRYLPPRAGCVTVLRADIDGDGRRDLILLYSRLSDEHPRGPGLPARLRRMYVPTRAVLKVVRASGGNGSVRIGNARAAAAVAVAHVNDDPGSELFLEFSRISSGANAVAYGFHDGRLVPAGVTLDYGGDSASKAGFDCLAGKPRRLIQRTFELIGSTIYAWWKETDITYAWHGPRLVKTAKRTFKRRGLPPASETDVGAGCTR
jgi:hypothetical protein